MGYPSRASHDLFALTVRLVDHFVGRSSEEVARIRNAQNPEGQMLRELEGQWERAACAADADASQGFSVWLPDGSVAGRRVLQALSAFEVMVACWPESELAWGWNTLAQPPSVAQTILPGLQAWAYTRPSYTGDADPALERALGAWQSVPFDARMLVQSIGIAEALGLRKVGEPVCDNGPNTAAARKLVEALCKNGVGFDGQELKVVALSQLALWSSEGWERGPPALAMAILERAPPAWWKQPVGDLSFLRPREGTLAEQAIAYGAHAPQDVPPDGFVRIKLRREAGFPRFVHAVRSLELENTLSPPAARGPRPRV